MKVRSRQDLIDEVRNAPATGFLDTTDRDQLLSATYLLPEAFYIVDEPKHPLFLHTIVEGPFPESEATIRWCELLTARAL